MYCQNCGNEVRDNDRFCGRCGTQIANEVIQKVPSNISKEQIIEGLQKNKKLVIGIGVAIIVIIGFLLVFNKDDVNSSPVNVVRAMFTAIDERDKKALIKCIAPEERKLFNEIMADDYYGINSYMKEFDEELEQQFGKNWSKKIQYKAYDAYEVEAIMEGDSETVEVYEIDGKYYVELYSF